MTREEFLEYLAKDHPPKPSEGWSSKSWIPIRCCGCLFNGSPMRKPMEPHPVDENGHGRLIAIGDRVRVRGGVATSFPSRDRVGVVYALGDGNGVSVMHDNGEEIYNWTFDELEVWLR